MRGGHVRSTTARLATASCLTHLFHCPIHELRVYLPRVDPDLVQIAEVFD